MTTELLLVQLLVLGTTGVLFWFARRDLASRAPSAPPPPPDTRELEQICVTLEALVTDLSRRMDRLERQTARLVLTGEAPPAPNPGRAGEESGKGRVGALLAVPSPPAPLRLGEGGEERAGRGSSAGEAPDTRYAPVYALLDAGETDPQEIARRTGLSRGEVDLILSLRARRAL